MPPANVEIKNIEILQSGSVDVYAYDDAGNRSQVASEPVIAQPRVTVNGKTLLETSPGVFEDDINVPGDSTLEIEAFWLVNGTKYGSFIDQSVMVQCQDIPPAPPY